jgi:endonuclease YncB( thermonuclease family)
VSLFDEHPIPYPVRILRAICERVIDGDTYHIAVDCGFHCTMTVPVRLRGVNAPELRTEAGKNARLAVQTLIEGKPVMLTPYRDRQSFARWVGDVQFYQPVDGTWQDLADWLVLNSSAVRV